MYIALALLSVIVVFASSFGLKNNVNAIGVHVYCRSVENAEAVFEQISKTSLFSINSHLIFTKLQVL